jgi:hypothetical protein
VTEKMRAVKINQVRWFQDLHSIEHRIRFNARTSLPDNLVSLTRCAVAILDFGSISFFLLAVSLGFAFTSTVWFGAPVLVLHY